MELLYFKLTYWMTLFWDYLRNILDILLVASILYWAYSYFSKTQAIQQFKGFIIIIVLAIISNLFHFETLNWLITTITSYLVIAIIILFQPELRRLITKFGQKNWFGDTDEKDVFQLDELVNAIFAMSDEKVGSLIVIERTSGLRNYSESGVAINAAVTEELLRTIFFPNTPLHDGAVIIQDAKISSAACYLPLSNSKKLKKNHGARHRAALGIAEESDALVLVSSEETGNVSIMVNGNIIPVAKQSEFKNMIIFFMNPKNIAEENYIKK